MARFNRLRLACALTILALLVAPASAQAAGRITGQVLNGMTGAPVPGAEITVEGSDATATTDPQGFFRLDIDAGSYVVVVTKNDFETERVTDVVVQDGQTANFAAVILPGSGTEAETASEAAFGETVTVEGQALAQSTEAALLLERRQAAEISDRISTEEISKTTGSDAAGVLKRVTGISLQEDKYVYVRGLGDRYSNTTLNGSRLPSTEFEKKVVPLDLFPAGMMDNISVAKSYTPDRPGDFVAGVVELNTMNYPDNQQATIGLSLGYNSETTGEPFLEYGDGLGFFGDGGQALSSSIPDQPLFRATPFNPDGFSRDELEEFGEALIGAWTPDRSSDGPLENGFKVSYGNSFGNFGMVLSANHDTDYTNRFEEQNIFSAAGGRIIPNSDYLIDYSEETVRQSLVGNFSWQPSVNSSIGLRAIYTNLAESQGRIQEGFFSDLNTDIRDFVVRYKDQEILNTQLNGEHFLSGVGRQGSLLEWRASYSEAATEENRRETIYELQSNDEYVLTTAGSSGFLFFNELNDEVGDIAADWTTFLGGSLQGSLQGGLAYTDNAREFDGRRLRFSPRFTRGVDLTLPGEELYTEENIGPAFEIEEITRPTDTYEGDQTVGAGYLMTDLAWDVWRLTAGVRVEQSDIEVVTFSRTNTNFDPIVTQLEDTDVLPAVSLVYQLGPSQNLRFALSQTVNRPEYRELAPFKFTDIVGGFAVQGNPDLVSATIQSFDARWEWFPGGAEVVAASLFYKNFDDPIELIRQSAGAEPLQTYINTEGAENFGAELEFRRNLGFLTERLDAFTTIVNYTWVESEIQIDPEDTILTNPTRPLAGQPDSILNLAVEWERVESGSSARLLYNFVGDKVDSGGTFGLPDVIEESRGTVDLIVRQDLSGLLEGLSVKVSGTNLLDEERLWTQGDGVYRRYEPGRSYGLSLSYDLF